MLEENHSSVLVGRLLGLIEDKFVLIDVGASGGISSLWDQFGSHLIAHGFDPLIAEIDRLNAATASNRIRYHAAFVTCRDGQIRDGMKKDGLFNTDSFKRTSAIRAARVAQIDYVREQFNSGASVHYTGNRTTIDQFCSEGLSTVDFIKIDTDGHDYYALRGAHETLITRGVLGVAIECPLHGTPHLHANTFANIDRYLRECGFALFDLNPWRYTRAALPGKFVYGIPAQTVSGQVQWCDALYLLDPITRPALFNSLSSAQLTKLLMLYDVFGLPDCAAELIAELKARTIRLPGADYSELLDALTPNGDYNSYVSGFDADPKTFYPNPGDT